MTNLNYFHLTYIALLSCVIQEMAHLSHFPKRLESVPFGVIHPNMRRVLPLEYGVYYHVNQRLEIALSFEVFIEYAHIPAYVLPFLTRIFF